MSPRMFGFLAVGRGKETLSRIARGGRLPLLHFFEINVEAVWARW